MEIHLQHLSSHEGKSFAKSRKNSYISQHFATGWDSVSVADIFLPCYLTSADTLWGSGVNTRTLTNLSAVSYFTKQIRLVDPVAFPPIYLTGARLKNDW
ncbi:MAG: hypothetical protein EOP51_06470 [Sphingobacteriales bacterium]|nr:MAG: hypothetical protein EOP51_06470 [Sphingobacteriales bacterium]